MKTLTLSIIIPVFNEEKTITQILKKVQLTKLPNQIKKEIIVVDDASTDGSGSKIQNSKFKYLKRIFHKQNKGKGEAIKSALKEATGEYIIIQDSDLEYDPSFYKVLIEPILKKKARVVYGTRLLNYPLKFWGKDKTVLPTHLIANKFLTFLTNLLYGSNLTDMETGYKLFKNEVIENINLKASGFDFEAEVTAKILKKGITIMEIPIITKPRSYKEGKKIGWRDGVSAVWTLIKYKFTD